MKDSYVDMRPILFTFFDHFPSNKYRSLVSWQQCCTVGGFECFLHFGLYTGSYQRIFSLVWAQRRLFDLYSGVIRKVFNLGGGWVIRNRTSNAHTFEMLYSYS